MKNRIELLKGLLDKSTAECVFLYSHETIDPNLQYLGLGIENSGIIINRKGKASVFVNRINERYFRERLKGHGFEKALIFTDYRKFVAQLKGKRTGINDKFLPFGLVPKTAGTKVKMGVGLLGARMHKDKEEVQAIAANCRTTRIILGKVEERLFQRSSEQEIAMELLKLTIDSGAEQAFRPIVATVNNSQYPHAVPGKRRIRGMALIDYGVRAKGYCSDLTRCYFQDRSKEKSYGYVKQVFWDAVDKLKQGITNRKLAEWYGQRLKKDGYKVAHSIGHGVGIEVHEHPFIKKERIKEIELVDTVMTLEPGIYLKDYGVRFEETVHVDRNNRVKVL